MSDINVQSFSGKVKVSNDLTVTTNVHADYFKGDGSLLTNLPSGSGGVWNTNSDNEIYFISSNVGISNADPGHNLSVGSNLYVDDDGSNVLVVTGNVKADHFVGDGSLLTGLSGSGGVWSTNAANEIYFINNNVGISNADPGHNLSVGSNLYVDDDGLDVLVVTGNVNATYLKGNGSLITNLPSGSGGVWSTNADNEIYFISSNVGISNSNPGHNLSVGSNLYVDDDGSNVLVVDGNIAAESIVIGGISIVPSYPLSLVTETGNITPHTIQFTNATTGLVVSSNIVVTGNVTAAYLHGDASNVTGITSNLHQIAENGNVTSNTLQFTNATTGLVTTGNVSVGKDLTVTGDMTAGYLYGDASNVTGITSNLHQIAENGNVTSNTLQFTNATTGLVTTGNVSVGGDLTVTGMLNLPRLASDPSPGVTGDVYFNTTSSFIRYYNGSVWGNVSNAPPTSTGGTVVIPSHSSGTSLTYDLGIDFEDDQDSDTQLTYTLVSGTLPTGSSLPSAGASTMSGTLTTIGTFNFVVQATDTGPHTSLQSYQIVVTPPVGQQTFTTIGTTTWVAPSGVTSVSVVCVGGGGSGFGWIGGGGAGGGLAWRNNVSVTPGTSYTVTVGRGGSSSPGGSNSVVSGSQVSRNGLNSGFLTTAAGGGEHGGWRDASGGQPTGGTYTGDGGGNGGSCEGGHNLYGGSSSTRMTSGGGGAGGYSGTGGKGAGSLQNGGSTVNATSGSGGGGGGGGARRVDLTTSYGGTGGGGVGLNGQGSNGAAGATDSTTAPTTQVNVNVGGGGGSGGVRGALGPYSDITGLGGDGGLYGGGGGSGGGSSGSSDGGNGGNGAVRIIWGPGRSFPSNAA